ncbi:hypothetical protein Q427_11285 [Halomonas sp. BC04]|nr:hypothetical protein Q427_11285 [Halomonas sp. BC04]
MPVSSQILLLLALPMVALLGLASAEVLNRWKLANDMAALDELVVLSTRSGEVIHQLQRERGVSAILLGSEGAQGRDTLIEQRRLTDAARQELNSLLATFEAERFGADFEAELSGALARISRLDEIRNAIDREGIAGLESNAYFTATIGEILDTLSAIANISPMPASPAKSMPM